MSSGVDQGDSLHCLDALQPILRVSWVSRVSPVSHASLISNLDPFLTSNGPDLPTLCFHISTGRGCLRDGRPGLYKH